MSKRHGNAVIQATYDPVEGRLVAYVIGEGEARKVSDDLRGTKALQDLKAAMARCALVCGMATKKK